MLVLVDGSRLKTTTLEAYEAKSANKFFLSFSALRAGSSWTGRLNTGFEVGGQEQDEVGDRHDSNPVTIPL
jgi:hypothetical protein